MSLRVPCCCLTCIVAARLRASYTHCHATQPPAHTVAGVIVRSGSWRTFANVYLGFCLFLLAFNLWLHVHNAVQHRQRVLK